MNTSKLIRELPRALFISIVIFVVLTIIPVLNGGEITFDNRLKISFLYIMLYGMSLYYVNAILFMVLDSVFKNNSAKRSLFKHQSLPPAEIMALVVHPNRAIFDVYGYSSNNSADLFIFAILGACLGSSSEC